MADHTKELAINCLHVAQEISNYLEGEIDDELRRRMEAHFSGCAHCTAILDGTNNVLRLVGDGEIFELPAGFSARLKARLAKVMHTV